MSNSTPIDLCHLDATELAAGYRTGEFSPVDVLDAVLARTERLNPTFNMFYHLDAAAARQAAEASTKRWQAKAQLGPLDGVPVSIKDSIAMQGTPMRVGSRAVHAISAEDGPPAARLREAGAVLFAKTTMPDHGMFGAGVSTAFGVTRNPWNPAFNTSGSSSGAAAALAARLGPLSIGSDIAGSVRLPASLCGLASIKPTHGVIPHLPVVAVRDAGPMARTARDLPAAFEVLTRADRRDYGSMPRHACAAPAWREPRQLRIGLLLDMGYGDPAEAAIVAAVRRMGQRLADAGARVDEMPALLETDPLPALVKVAATTTLARLEAMTAQQREQSYPRLREFAEQARSLSALDLHAAHQAIDAAKAVTVQKTSAYDYVLAPVLSTVNWPAEKDSPNDDDIYRLTSFCGMYNQTGQPVGCVCAGFDDRGLPIGMQIVGQRFDDLGVLQLAQLCEELRGFRIEWPACE